MDTSNTRSATQKLNEQISIELNRDNIVSLSILKKIKTMCDEQNLHLGQTLVKNGHLSITQLSNIIRAIRERELDSQTVAASQVRYLRPNNAADGEQTLDYDAAACSNEPPPQKAFGGDLLMRNNSQFADYEIIDEIARGGMGIVYRARQKDINRVIALKVLLSGSNADSKQIKRFFREAEAVARLSHPNIIPIFKMGQESGYYYFTMRYIEGETFAHFIKREHESLDAKIAIFIKVCYALHEAHKHQILHRDIKPSNVLLDKTGEPFLSDFGLAKLIDHKSAITQTGAAMGTPFYMPPEQILGKTDKIDRRSDIYSLGVVLYQILTNKLPFTGETIANLYYQITNVEPVSPRVHDRSIPKALEAICLKAMDKKVQYRYATAREMALDLDNYIQGASIQAQRFQLRYFATRYYRAHRLLVHILLVLSIFVVVPGVLWYRSQKYYEDMALIAQKRCVRARTLYSYGNYQKALTVLSTASVADKSYQIQLELGHIYQKLEKNTKARRAFHLALQLAPQMPEVWYAKSKFHYHQQEYDHALTWIEKYIRKNLQHAHGYRLKSLILRKLGRLKAAAIATNAANRLESQTLQQKICDLAYQPHANAIAILDDLLNQHPHYEKAYVSRAQIYYQQKKILPALRDISYALELNPCANYYFTQGKWLSEAGYLEKAERSLQQAIKIAGNDQRSDIFRLLADVELRLQKYDAAYTHYRQIQPKKPSSTIALQMGKAALGQQKLTCAKRHLQQVIEDKTVTGIQRADALYYLGSVYYRRKNADKAIDYWRKALNLQSSQSKHIHRHLGKMYFKAEQFSQAAAELQIAASDFPLDAEIHWLLSCCHQKQGHDQIALEALAHCIALEPWKYKYYLARGRIYRKLGNYLLSDKDFVVCYQLQPSDIMPLVEFYENILAEDNMSKMHLFGRNFRYWVTSFQPPDLFTDELRELREKCMRRASKLGYSQEVWDKNKHKQAQIFLQGLIDSNSPAVHDMAFTALMAMYRYSPLHDLVAAKLREQKLLSIRRRLKNIGNKIRAKYVAEEKIRFRQLLVRYFDARDQRGLKEIYDRGTSGNYCLQALLTDEQENPIIRFFAARALIALRTTSANRIWQHHSRQGSPLTQLFCNAALRAEKLPITNAGIFRQALKFDNPYSRALAARYIPITNTEDLRKFLHDQDLRVQILAASRLRKAGKNICPQKLLQCFTHPSPVIRANALHGYWDFHTMQHLPRNTLIELFKQFDRNFSRWLQATNDSDPRVRSIALKGLERVKGKQATRILARHLHEHDELLRLQVIMLLALRNDFDLIVPIMTNIKEKLIFRAAAFLGTKGHWWQTALPQTLMFALGQVSNDPDPRLSLLAYATIAQSGNGEILLRSRLKSSDARIRLNCIVAMLWSEAMNFLPYVEKSFQDPNYKVRMLAAAAAIYISGLHEAPRYQHYYHQLQKNKSADLYKGAAMGYVKLVHDRLEHPYDNLIWDWSLLYRYYIQNMEQIARELITGKRKPGKTYPKSIADFRECLSRAVEFDPENVEACFELGIFEYVQGNYRQSIDHIKTACKYRQSTLLKLWLAKAYYQAQKYRKALRISSNLYREFPWDTELCALQAKILRALDRIDQAKKLEQRYSLLKK